MGLCFVIIGLNFWAKWFQLQRQGAAKRFLDAMEQSGYMHAVKGIEVSGGVLLLSGFNIPLALMLLGPVIANIFLFHACLDKRHPARRAGGLPPLHPPPGLRRHLPGYFLTGGAPLRGGWNVQG
jgi:uncharacterized membrane protein YphA (DoxX/SURF4 family)